MPNRQSTLTELGPTPFRQFIVKLHSRCNLACDYCYVYTMADQRWRHRPRTMSRTVVEHTALRIAEHASAHRLRNIELVVHGGEPLLAGADAIEHLVTAVRSAVSAPVGVTVQTNATLLDSGFLDLFRELDIGVAVSLDGGPAANDRHRLRRDGTGSYHAVHRALRSMGRDEFRPLFRGILCAVDIANDPIGTYEALLDFAPPRVDLLLPHGNWTARPPGLREAAAPGVTPYADWLIAVFDRWYGAPARETGVRIFEEIINVLLGGHSRLEGIGLAPAAMVVVETDGMIERSDTLASAFEGAAATGLHVSRDPFDAALRRPDVRDRQHRTRGLAGQCRACGLRAVCGGGLRAHRFRAVGDGAGFANPSVYCADLYRLIAHIRARLAADVAGMAGAAGQRRRAG